MPRRTGRYAAPHCGYAAPYCGYAAPYCGYAAPYCDTPSVALRYVRLALRRFNASDDTAIDSARECRIAT